MRLCVTELVGAKVPYKCIFPSSEVIPRAASTGAEVIPTSVFRSWADLHEEEARMTVEASRTQFLCVFGVADGAAEVAANAAHPLLLD